LDLQVSLSLFPYFGEYIERENKCMIVASLLMRVKLGSRTVSFTVSPVHATILLHFQDQGSQYTPSHTLAPKTRQRGKDKEKPVMMRLISVQIHGRWPI
jgi:hypothetical protein